MLEHQKKTDVSSSWNYMGRLREFEDDLSVEKKLDTKEERKPRMG